MKKDITVFFFYFLMSLAWAIGFDLVVKIGIDGFGFFLVFFILGFPAFVTFIRWARKIKEWNDRI